MPMFVELNDERIEWIFALERFKITRPKNRYKSGMGLIPCNIMLSYAFIKNQDMGAEKKKIEEVTGYKPKIIADSGAFSVMSRGEKISLEEYAEWGLRWQHVIDDFINLDVIYDAKSSQQNWERLAQLGLRTLPVFHLGGDFGVLNELAAEHNTICLGGLVRKQNQQKQVINWIMKCFSTIAGRAKIHALGVSSAKLLYLFPFRSTDSSNFSLDNRYGNFAFVNQHTGALTHRSRKSFAVSHRLALAKKNIDLFSIMNAPRLPRFLIINAYGLYTYMHFIERLRKVQQKRNQSQTDFYFAAAFLWRKMWCYLDIIREMNWVIDDLN